MAIRPLEAEAPEFAGIIERTVQPRISAVTYLEAGAVIDGSKDPIAGQRFCLKGKTSRERMSSRGGGEPTGQPPQE